ncbi:tRNA(Ile)-lysidine synthase [Desulfosarcina alkanivorans]|uniref:tRNA(Ile)-lysidine synthase n=2 Tax=Desulfosarcina alkanivorans TaxID=571177 RepID=A0A5K7YUL0_9BACT|nr:tRNA(Ile)-lysidine synthase [Desulfosarcina alkanivorans]
MLAPGDRVLVGVSGGPDSMALLHLLLRLAPGLDIGLGIAHLNHCLRGASADRDARFVRQAAATLNIACHTGRAQVIKVKRKLRLSLEEAGRRVRYAFFSKTMADAGYNKLALGHHSDDNAEQILMAILRGTGPRGLSGIAPVRRDRIIRPMIHVRRSQIEDFVRKAGIACVRDASNEDLRFVRNRIRHRLLPLLAAEYNPRIADHLNRMAEVMREEAAWTDGLVAAEYQRAMVARSAGVITISAGALKTMHPALARRLVRDALQDLTGTLRRITFAHVQAALRLLADGCDGKECHLPGGIRTRRTGDHIVLQVAAEGRRGAAERRVEEERVPATRIPAPLPERVEIQAMGIGFRFFSCLPDQLPPWGDVDRNRAHFDLARLSLPLTVRPAVPGDRFTPLGAGGSQKLKKFFIDHRIPRQERSGTPVLADQQRIIWLVGQRMDDHVKVTASTSKVLVVEFFLLDTR